MVNGKREYHMYSSMFHHWTKCLGIVASFLLIIPKGNETSLVSGDGSIGSMFETKYPMTANYFSVWRGRDQGPGALSLEGLKL